jgi:diguanylate cyclase (GGDEF)-like protein
MLRALRDPITAALSDGSDHWDDVNTRWMGALVLVLGAVLSGVLLAIVPPTAEGVWGWKVAAAVIAFRLVAAVWLATGRGRIRHHPVYAISIAGIAGLCLQQFLASEEAFFHDLILIDLLYVAAVHTPRRSAVALALAIGGVVPSLVRSGPETVTVAEWGAEAILWTLVVGLVVLYTTRARGQRAELRHMGMRAQALARVDALTGLGNRRAFDEALDRELGHARRYGTRLSVLVGDLDGFKAVNDGHGHAAGDELLRQVAVSISDAVRRPDACFRWGGDEFAVVLPATSRDRAELVAGRIHAAVARRVHDPAGAPVVISVGAAELLPDQEPADVLAAADAALLAAKSSRPAPRRPPWRFGRTEARDAGRRR